jgi:hypothetical protein
MRHLYAVPTRWHRVGTSLRETWNSRLHEKGPARLLGYVLKITMKCYEMPHYNDLRRRYTGLHWKPAQRDVKPAILRLEVSAKTARSFSGTIAIDNLGDQAPCCTPSTVRADNYPFHGQADCKSAAESPFNSSILLYRSSDERPSSATKTRTCSR